MKVFILLILSLSFVGCSLDKDSDIKENKSTYPFGWVKSGSRLIYDYQDSFTNIANALYLDIRNTAEEDRYLFDFSSPNGSPAPYFTVGYSFDFYKKKDGLYTHYCTSCSLGPCFYTENSLRVPKSPTLNNIYIEYICQNSVWTGYQVKSLNDTITTPLDSYQTFTLLDTAKLYKEFWSEKYGLIRIEKQNKDGMVIASWNLKHKNY